MATAATEIRGAQIADADELARLSGELGYPLTPDEMRQRLAALLPSDRHYVAVVPSGGRLLGWVHVEHRSSLESGDRAELVGLVVDSTVRRRGIGRLLLAAAEHWALARGLATLTVRSNVARELSHPFYASLGYERAKTQHVYRKTLVGPRAG